MKIIAAFLALIALCVPAWAEEPYGQVSFLRGYRLDDGQYQTALRFNLAEGWNTYWRTPGPTGIPPRFDWSGSTNLADVEILWPMPHVSTEDGYFSATYTGDTVVPVRLKAANPNKPVHVKLRVDFGVCSDICVPASENISAKLDSGHAEQEAKIIRTALESRAKTGPEGGVLSATCAFIPRGDGIGLEANLAYKTAPPAIAIVAMEYPSEDIWIDETEVSRSMSGLTLKSGVEFYGEGAMFLNRDDIIITVFSEEARAVEVRGCAD